jgi:hypothetical protein
MPPLRGPCEFCGRDIGTDHKVYCPYWQLRPAKAASAAALPAASHAGRGRGEDLLLSAESGPVTETTFDVDSGQVDLDKQGLVGQADARDFVADVEQPG